VLKSMSPDTPKEKTGKKEKREFLEKLSCRIKRGQITRKDVFGLSDSGKQEALLGSRCEKRETLS